jgi:hypothetical protein
MFKIFMHFVISLKKIVKFEERYFEISSFEKPILFKKNIGFSSHKNKPNFPSIKYFWLQY